MKLIPRTRDEVRAAIDAMPPDQRAWVSADYLAQLERSPVQDPWVHGFNAMEGEQRVGMVGFKGPPVDGIVEIAYSIEPEHQGKGHATEATRAAVAYAFETGQVRTVRAHTLPVGFASQRVLEKCGFSKTAEVVDPEDGLVWRFEVAQP
jgi:ribosomal-protein-alanine N-acetyltransferase